MKIIFLSGFMCLLCACNLDRLLFKSSESIETVELQQVYERSGRVIGKYMIIGDKDLKQASTFTCELRNGPFLAFCETNQVTPCWKVFRGGFGIYYSSGKYFIIRGFQ